MRNALSTPDLRDRRQSRRECRELEEAYGRFLNCERFEDLPLASRRSRSGAVARLRRWLAAKLRRPTDGD